MSLNNVELSKNVVMVSSSVIGKYIFLFLFPLSLFPTVGLVDGRLAGQVDRQTRPASALKQLKKYSLHLLRLDAPIQVTLTLAPSI